MPNLPVGYTNSFLYYPKESAVFRNLMVVASKTLPDYSTFFDSSIRSIDNLDEAKSVILHLLNIIKMEKECDSKKTMFRVFDSADEKMKQAGLCFQNTDYPSVFHNLNTALELVLKDKLNIPSTITSINTSNIIDIWVKYKIESYLYLIEARKHVLNIDNKIKHQGYAPSKIDSINGIKAMEELIGKLRNVKLELSEEARNKIFEGL